MREESFPRSGRVTGRAAQSYGSVRRGMQAAAALLAFAAAVRADDAPRLDHLLIGVADLDGSVDALAKTLGVVPRHGGNHPGGTHNALIALGPSTYLELIALQPGVDGDAIGMADLVRLDRPTPIGWAVSSSDLDALRRRLERAGFSPGPPSAGSRTTPAGDVLRWHAFELENAPVGAPFFLVWSDGSAHPATTSPGGCTLTGFSVATPDGKELRKLATTLGVDVDVNPAADAGYTIELGCPTGPVTFPTAVAAPVTGADRDAHDCIASAGYSWCARTKQCERPWELAKGQSFENTKAAFESYCGGSGPAADDGFPRGHDSPEGAAADLARAFIERDAALFRETCIAPFGGGESRRAYETFLAETKKAIEAEASKPSGGGPKAIAKVFAARHLTMDGPASYGHAMFGFRDVRFVDVGAVLQDGTRMVNRTLVIQDDKGKWYANPAPALWPLLSAGLNEEAPSTE